MPPQQASELSDSRLAKANVRGVVPRPHLVSTEHWASSEGEVDAVAARDNLQTNDRTKSYIRVLESESHVALPLDRGGREARPRPTAALLKRAIDVVGAIVLGLAFLPVMIVIAALLRAEGGPIIYRHRRIGRGGQIFECFKFRSMVPNAERVLRDLLEKQPDLKAEWLRDHKLRTDPRVTRLGRFLRRTSLDELPQIWNVLRGEMSLVGPRPVVREELMRYGHCLPIYLSAKPGITGLWQVMGRNNTDYRRRVVLDIYYVRKHNLGLDLYILFKTPRVMLGGGGAY